MDGSMGKDFIDLPIRGRFFDIMEEKQKEEQHAYSI